MKRAIISLVAAAGMVLSPITALAEEGTSTSGTAAQAPLAPGEECDAEDRDDSGHCVGIPLVVWIGAAAVVGGAACVAGGCTSGGGDGGTTQTTATP